MKRSILVIVSVLIMTTIGISSCGGSSEAGGGSFPLEGSWECSYVMIEGEQMIASSEQTSDYTLDVEGRNFKVNIYGVETTGTLEFNTTVDLGDDGDLDSYIFTTNSGTTVPVWHYRKYDTVLFYMYGEASSDNYIAFEKVSK